MAPQFSIEQRIFIALQYSMKKGTKGFKKHFLEN